MQWDQATHTLLLKVLGAVATIGLFSVLYKENKFFRFFEHVFLGLAAGFTVSVVWFDVVMPVWADKTFGVAKFDEARNVIGSAQPGRWPYALLLPISLMAYFVFSKKHNWISRIPLGIILGIWAGQQIQNWAGTYLPQARAAMQPVWPTTFDRFTAPTPPVPGELYPSQALGNLFYVITILSVLSYFLFSFEIKSKAQRFFPALGRYLLMIGFGAMFGNTVTMRFALLIDRMYAVAIELPEAISKFFNRG